jgi:hypothetical protein
MFAQKFLNFIWIKKIYQLFYRGDWRTSWIMIPQQHLKIQTWFFESDGRELQGALGQRALRWNRKSCFLLIKGNVTFNLALVQLESFLVLQNVDKANFLLLLHWFPASADGIICVCAKHQNKNEKTWKVNAVKITNIARSSIIVFHGKIYINTR